MVDLNMAGEDCLSHKYRFLDHTADVQIHARGDNLKEAFENAAVAMTAYITDINKVDIMLKEEFKVEADDVPGLLFRFLDEVLFLFNADPYLLSKRVSILEFETEPTCKISAECYGEPFCMGKHPQGTEIKAITYSAMKIKDESDCHEVYFIVDI